jgi:hypothetical protein
MRRVRFLILYIAACSMHLLPQSALTLNAAECSQRVGPFATQTTAWQRWRQARGLGYSVSNGVVPCWQDKIRGYCFFVYYPC